MSYRSTIASAGLVGWMLVSLFLTSGCENADGGVDAGGAGARRQRRPLPVATAVASRGEIKSYYRATATVDVDKDADVVARIAGIIGSIEVEEDQAVEVDQVLLRIEDAEFRLRVDLATAKRENLESKYNRIRKLSEDVIPAEEIETARSAFEAAKAEEELAKLSLSYAQVEAPFSGRIVRRLVDPGEKVTVDQPLFYLADLSVLLARVHVPSKEFKNVRVGQEVELRLDSKKGKAPAGDRSAAQEPLLGRVKIISPTIDSSTGTIKVTVEIPSFPEGTRPGDFAEVLIVTDVHEDVLLVRKASVVIDREEPVVFIAKDGTAERRVVEVGISDDSHSEILNGVEAGEEIIVKGQRSAKHGMPINVINGSSSKTPRPVSKTATPKKPTPKS